MSKSEKTRVRKPFLNYLPGIIAFVIPVFVMIVIFISRGIYPFGDRTFLRTDLYHQYAPFFQELKDKLSSGESLFYTWDIGLGTNFIAIFGYYLASPLNWLLYLCPRTHVIEFITGMIVLKMAASSATMTWYLNRHNRTNSIAAALFGSFYGLSGYMAAFSWNIMWLDCLILFPVIIAGVENLLNEDNGFLYAISLGLCILTNYYIAIMVCIGMVVYFILRFFLTRGKNINYALKIFNFTVFSLLAGGLSAVILLPEIKALAYTASAKSSFPKTWSSYFSMFDMLARHLMSVQIEIGLDHWPNIYCGVGVLFFFPLYLMNKRIPMREKIAYCFVLLFFLLSFSTNTLNFIWHGFHYPNSLPCRQSFIYIFLLLAVCYKGFLGLKGRTIPQIGAALAFAVSFCIAAEKLEASYTGSGDDMYYMWYCFYLSIGFLLAYGGISVVYRKTKGRLHPLWTIVAAILVTVEALINMTNTSVTTVSRTTYMEFDDNVRSMVNTMLEEEDSLFVRVEKVRNRTKNDGAWLDYPSASIFSSTAYAEMTAFYKKIGLESSTNAYGTTGSSLASNMLLGIRYSLVTDSDTGFADDDFVTFYQDKSNVDMYINTYALPVGFLVSDTLEGDWSTVSDDPAMNWNSLSDALGIDDPLFVPVGVVGNASSNVSMTAVNDGYYYIYPSKSGPGTLRVNCDGRSRTWENLSRNYFIPLGRLGEGVVTTITNKDSSSTDNITVFAYRMDTSVLVQIYDALNRNPFVVTKKASRALTGTVAADTDGVMLFTIPYDAGWRVTVDGEKVETAIFEDAFLSFPISQGEHTIVMKYTPDGFFLGLIVTVLSILLLVLIQLSIRLWRLKHPVDPEFQEVIYTFLPYGKGTEPASRASLTLDSEDDEAELSEDDSDSSEKTERLKSARKKAKKKNDPHRTEADEEELYNSSKDANEPSVVIEVEHQEG